MASNSWKKHDNIDNRRLLSEGSAGKVAEANYIESIFRNVVCHTGGLHGAGLEISQLRTVNGTRQHASSLFVVSMLHLFGITGNKERVKLDRCNLRPALHQCRMSKFWEQPLLIIHRQNIASTA